MEASEAAKLGDPDALRCALEARGEGEEEEELEAPWDYLMEWVIESGSLDCVKVLYDKGYEQHRSEDPNWHPAIVALSYGHLAILRFVVDHSNPPDPEIRMFFISGAAKGGVEMLQYVQELGWMFNGETTATAASIGDLEALRYLHKSGAPWDSKTLAATLRTGSLPCLEYAHMHGCPQEDEENWEHWDYWENVVEVAPSLPVLRYVCEHMDPAFAATALKYVAVTLAETRPDQNPELWESQLDWPVVLYLGRKLGTALPEPLAEARANQQERAAALAGVFWKADKWQRAEEARLLHREAAGKRQRTSGGEENREITDADAEQTATWDAMARVPKELRERIAVEAHLIIL
jgi:hypothetical protein